MKLLHLPRKPRPKACDRPSLEARRRVLVRETRLMLVSKLVLVLSAIATIALASDADRGTMLPGILFLLFVCLFLVIDIAAGNVYSELESVDDDLDHLDAVDRIEDRELHA